MRDKSMKHNRSVYLFILFWILKSIHLCGMNSIIDQTCTISSKVELLETKNVSFESVICTIDEDLITINSKLDTINSDNSLGKACSAESIIDLINTTISTTNSGISIIDIHQSDIYNANLTIEHNVVSVLSKFCTIDSVLDNIELHIETVSSHLDTINTINSKVDILYQPFASIKSKWCVIDATTNSIDSSIDIINNNITTANTTSANISSQIDISLSKIASVDNLFSSVHSIIDILSPETATIISKICNIDSITDIMNSKIDIIANIIVTAQTISMNQEVNFQHTWTTLNQVQQTLNTAQSRADFTNSRIDFISLTTDQSGTFSVINALSTVNQDIISNIDVIQQNMDAVNNLPYKQTFTVMNDILSKLSQVDSLMDELLVTVTVLNPLQNCLGTPLYNTNFPPASGYTISSGGRYYLAEDIRFAPSANNVNMITLANTASNVYLDLNGKTVTQTNGDTITGNKAITSPVGAKRNVVIANGAIRDFSSEALFIGGNGGITNLLVQDIFVENIGMGNSNADAFNIKAGNNPCRNVIFRNITIASTFIGDGFDLEECTNVLMENCKIYNIGYGGAGNGILIQLGSDNYIIKDCIIDKISTGDCIAITDDSGASPATNILIENCILSGAYSTNATRGRGIFMRQISDATIRGCTIINNNADGIHFDSAANAKTRVVVIDNNISYNKRTGIRFESTSCTNNAILFNTFVGNGTNILATSAAIGSTNTFLGNVAYNGSDTANYTSLTTTPKTTVNQTKAFPTTLPKYWENISMVP